MNKLPVRYSLGSFAYRYAIGVKGFMPSKPMDAEKFLQRAAALGYQHVLLCENLHYMEYSNERLAELDLLAQKLGLMIDVGFRGLVNLERHLEIAYILHAKELRVVLGENSMDLAPDPDGLVQQSIRILCDAAPRLESEGFTLGIENNFELPIDRLIEIVDAVGSTSIALIMDCTNCLGLLESPYDVIKRMGKRVRVIHLKDYRVRKVEAGYRVEGLPLGKGWLAVRRFLEWKQQIAPDASITIEYGMRRSEGASLEETLQQEQRSNEQDAKFLFQLVN